MQYFAAYKCNVQCKRRFTPCHNVLSRKRSQHFQDEAINTFEVDEIDQ